MLTTASLAGLTVSCAAALIPAASPAAAGAEGRVVCQREGAIEITPGLTFTPTNATFDERGTFPSCSGPGADGLTAVLNGDDYTISGTCASVEGKAPTFTIKWSDGKTSTGSARVAFDPFPPFAKGTGTITKGRFAGKSFVTKVLANPENPQQCFTSGVTKVSFTGDFTFE